MISNLGSLYSSQVKRNWSVEQQQLKVNGKVLQDDALLLSQLDVAEDCIIDVFVKPIGRTTRRVRSSCEGSTDGESKIKEAEVSKGVLMEEKAEVTPIIFNEALPTPVTASAPPLSLLAEESKKEVATSRASAKGEALPLPPLPTAGNSSEHANTGYSTDIYIYIYYKCMYINLHIHIYVTYIHIQTHPGPLKLMYLIWNSTGRMRGSNS